MFDWFGDDKDEEERQEKERRQDIEDILDSYEHRFDGELPSDTGRVESRDYQAYKEAEEAARKESWYEKLVNRLSFFRFEFEDVRTEHADAIRLLNWNIHQSQIGPAALVVAGVLALAVAPVMFMDVPPIFKLFSGAIPFGMFAYLVKYPKLKARQKVVNASEELIFAVLYMVIYMRSSPNLEGAIGFAARHLEGPVEKDLKLVLWRLDVREYTTVSEALEDYIQRWRPYNEGFVQALNLIKSATAEASTRKRNEILSEAIDTLLEDTQERMDSFARQLKLPVMALYGLGILLPVLVVILFPMIAAFMGGSGMTLYLVALYNVILPFTVYAVMKNLLVSRPLSLSSRSGKLLGTNPGKVKITVGSRAFNVPVFVISGLLFILLVAWPAPHYYQAFVGGGGLSLSPAPLTFLREMMMVVALAIPLGVHLYLGYRGVVEEQTTLQSMEAEFPEVLFELSNALDRGQPVELAVEDAAKEQNRLDIADMFTALSQNMRERGMTFQDALFDSEFGAVQQYPSKLIRTVMEVIAESTEKGPGVAASAAGTISSYLDRIKETQRQLEELMEDTLSSLTFLAYVLAPVITGVAVGMGAVISLAFSSIEDVATQAVPQNTTANATGPGSVGTSQSFMSLFQVQDAIPPGVLQLVVGVYLIQVSILIGTLSVRLTDGRNPAKRNAVVGKMLVWSIPIYTIVTLALVIMFGGMIRGVV